MSNPKVTIIIPIYNAEVYLKETLETVRSQTYSNTEVLLIDDGSTDSSGGICDEYSRKYSFFRAFHLKNGGVARARNFALEKMTGDYVTFVDSDDLVKPGFIETMVQVALKNKAEIVTSRFFDGQQKNVEEFKSYQCKTMPDITSLTFLEYSPTGQYAHNTVWRGVYAADLARQFRFVDDLKVGEDTLFFYQMLKKAGRLVFVDEYYYYYRYRNDSLAHAKYSLETASEITAWERVCHLFSDQPDAVQTDFKAALAMRCRKNYINARLANYQNPELYAEIIKKARALWKNVQTCENISWKGKLKYWLFITFPNAYLVYVRKQS